MVPAYVGYLLLDALDGNDARTDDGRGDAALPPSMQSTAVTFGNMTDVVRTALRSFRCGPQPFRQRFLRYTLNPDGTPARRWARMSTRTAGGVLEGGYLGFAETVMRCARHLRASGWSRSSAMALFEEARQRLGATLIARRSGFSPIIILNGRRIQSSAARSQLGAANAGSTGTCLRPERFSTVTRWMVATQPALHRTIYAMETGCRPKAASGEEVHLPYGIAETVRGCGFPGAEPNAARQPATARQIHRTMHRHARALQNEGAARLLLPPAGLTPWRSGALNTHKPSNGHANETTRSPRALWRRLASRRSPIALRAAEFANDRARRTVRRHRRSQPRAARARQQSRRTAQQ